MLQARPYPGGDDPALIGLAMVLRADAGPDANAAGLASDRFGRKRVIVLGLAVFALAAASRQLPPAQMVAGGAGLAAGGRGHFSCRHGPCWPTSRARRSAHQGHGADRASIGLMFALSLVIAAAGGRTGCRVFSA